MNTKSICHAHKLRKTKKVSKFTKIIFFQSRNKDFTWSSHTTLIALLQFHTLIPAPRLSDIKTFQDIAGCKAHPRSLRRTSKAGKASLFWLGQLGDLRSPPPATSRGSKIEARFTYSDPKTSKRKCWLWSVTREARMIRKGGHVPWPQAYWMSHLHSKSVLQMRPCTELVTLTVLNTGSVYHLVVTWIFSCRVFTGHCWIYFL